MKTRPNWYTKEHDGTWERVKAAFKNDWEQTKNDFGVKGNRDLDQDVDDTVKQMAGKQSTVRYGEYEWDELESAFKYGHAAHGHYGKDYPDWNDELSSKLAADYDRDWKRDEPLGRYAYRYNFSRM